MTLLHKTIASELGLSSLYHSCPDTKIIILQRFIRFFAFGGSTIVLALYLHSISLSDTQIGLFFSLTLVGDLISFTLTLLADGVGRKIVLGLGASLMVFSGITFAVTGNFWLLLAASVFGIISPNGREIGPFSAIEESTLAHLTPPAIRSDIFAWYTVIGSAGSSCGKLIVGKVVQHLETVEGWDQLRAYQAVFLAYAGLAAVNVMLSFVLSSKVEMHGNLMEVKNRNGEEEEPLLSESENENDELEVKKRRPLLSRISKESRGTILILCLLFAVDSLASGLVPASWVTYFFHVKFNLNPGDLGSLFFVTGILSSISSLVAASLSKRIGLVKTMVFTHLPSAIALSLIPIPSSLSGAITFLVIRSSLASMDIAPKAAFLSIVVLPQERTAVMGLISVVRTFSQSWGPLITGVLAQAGKFWVTFLCAGILKSAYDVGLLSGFRAHRTDVDRSEEPRNVEHEA